MSSTTPDHWLIIPSAGVGSRMQMDRPKEYLQVGNKTILERTLSCFTGFTFFQKILLGIAADDREAKSLQLEQHFPILSYFEGGKERAETVLNGLSALAGVAKNDDWVWVHDAARPCLSEAEIKSLMQNLETESCGLVLAIPVSDTLKRARPEKDANDHSFVRIDTTVDRSHLWRAMTPQVFRYADLKRALTACLEQGIKVTDEASAIEFCGGQPRLVVVSDENIKVTLADDLAKVAAYFKRNTTSAASETALSALVSSTNYMRQQMRQYPKIGTGYDVHAFDEGEFITLGGVKIPYQQGLRAHSDGDVLLHALMDAMLGALALGDIGKHFPDTEMKWKGADSRKLLRHVNQLLREHGYIAGNIDSTIIAQAPKMAPHIVQMQKNIAEDLSVDVACVSVKATTTESLGFTGRKEGIACQASVLLLPVESMSESS